ncbi:MAG TPA: DUF1080 domain-containing protein [Candidatus Binatia bacterium]|jgi:hypothetical protein|nr:DUF1080 domain-containing protein [Candidatus Binatia bacterium]
MSVTLFGVRKLSSGFVRTGWPCLLCALVVVAGCATQPKPEPNIQTPEPAIQVTPPPTPTNPPSPTGSQNPGAATSSTFHPPSSGLSLFDGATLTGWRETAFAGHGEIEVKSGQIVLNMGDPFTGLNYTNDFPKMNYEVSLDAMRVMGSDFFCGLTVPVGDSFCSLIVGGWGGSLVGISCLDGEDASENETTKFENFESKRWYHIRLRVTPDRLEVWIDKDKMVDVVTTGRTISLRLGDIELSKPFGIACWQTTAALRDIKVATLKR